MTAAQERYIETCPVGCAAALTITDIVLPEGPLLRCRACGQLVSQVTAARYWETMAQFDRADYNLLQGRELARRNRVARRRLRRIAALLGTLPAGIRLLDVGCSRGHFVAAAVAAGFTAEGVEPAPQVAAAARATGLMVHTGLLEKQQFTAASFDAVTLFEVIEHLKKPHSLLAECRRILKPRGVLVLSTGNTASWTVAAMGARWDYFHLAKDGGHVSFFNPISIKRLAAACGFGLERMENSRVRFIEKTDAPPWRYALGKAAAELLSFPARLLGRGHDMVAYLRAT